jgi:hypothetical protein
MIAGSNRHERGAAVLLCRSFPTSKYIGGGQEGICGFPTDDDLESSDGREGLRGLTTTYNTTYEAQLKFLIL